MSSGVSVRAKPKSQSFTVSSGVSRMFAGFRSRCMTCQRGAPSTGVRGRGTAGRESGGSEGDSDKVMGRGTERESVAEQLAPLASLEQTATKMPRLCCPLSEPVPLSKEVWRCGR
eukprot:355147-Chlamydomonas_euryale.AAC.6